MKTYLLCLTLLVGATSFAQTTACNEPCMQRELRWASGTPYIDFSNDANTDYDARFILYNDDLVWFYGGDLGIAEGSVRVTGVNAGININASWASYLKMGDANTGNPSLQLVTDWSGRDGTMIVNNWGNPSNPGVAVGTTRVNDGVAFSVVRGVQLVNGLPSTEGEQIVTVLGNGNMGVGTNAPDAKLAVNGQIHATEVRVTANVPGPDYVFEKEYALVPLDELRSFIEKNKHLPEVPSAKQMEEDGIKVGEMNLLLLKKVEELTLYVLQLKEELDKVKAK